LSEFRYCKLTKEWTLFAPERLKRPNNLDNKKQATPKNIVSEKCPFDMHKEEYTPHEITRITQNGEWQCRVVPNLYNALLIDIKASSTREGFFEKFSGFGAHEVVIETPIHDKQIWDYSFNDLTNYLTIIQSRIVSLKNDVRLEYISVFKNQGSEAGASMSHSHSQIMALPFIPKKVLEEYEYKKEYYQKHKRALLDDILYEEMQNSHNIISQNSEFVLYCPYASSFPFEVKIVSKKKLSSLLEFTKSDISALSDILKEFFTKFYSALGEISFNMIINNAPYKEYDDQTKEFYRFNIEIKPRIYKQAGFELDSNININVVLPEQAAKIYKES
jgi:UDPglucose--hexose-1-phosphate uridylyltransferase